MRQSMTRGCLVVAAAVLQLVSPSAGRAQSSNGILFGGGVSFPAGVLNSYANTGWDVTAGVEHRFGHHPTALRIDFSYASNSDTTGVGFHETTRLINLTANIVYHFPGAQPRIYVLAGIGDFVRHFTSADPFDFGVSDARLGLQVGEGIVFHVKSAALFLEGRFVTGVGPQPLRFFPVILGVRFGGDR